MNVLTPANYRLIAAAFVTAIMAVMLSGCSPSSEPEEEASADANEATEVADDSQSTASDDDRPAENPDQADSDTTEAESQAAADDDDDNQEQDVLVAEEEIDQPTAEPTVTFELSTDGLPESGMWKSDPVFADVNGDGHLDLAALPRLGNGPHIFLGDGNGNWTDSSEDLRRERGAQSCGGGLAFGDVNNDGHLDLCVADHCDGVFVFLGDGEGNWENVVSSLYPVDVRDPDDPEAIFVGAEDLDVGDVNGDGHLDIVASASDEGGINVYLGNGTGREWEWQENLLPTNGWATSVMLVDLDEDGLLDIVASYSEGPRVWLNLGDGDWRPSWDGLPSPSMAGIFMGLAVEDFNEDGLLDIAVANWINGPELFIQQDDASWEQAPDLFPAMRGGAVGLAVGRIDLDDHVDMVVTGRMDFTDRGYERGTFFLRSNGDGSFDYVPESGFPATGLGSSWGAAVADINDDGLLDVAVCSGLIVETTTAGPQQPVIDSRIIVWLTRPVDSPVDSPIDSKGQPDQSGKTEASVADQLEKENEKDRNLTAELPARANE